MQIHLSVSGARVYLPLSDVADRFSIGNAALNNIHMLLVSEQLIGTAHCLSSEGDTGRMLAIVGGGVWSGWLGTFAQNVLSDLETHSCFMGCCRMPLTYLTTGIRLMRKKNIQAQRMASHQSCQSFRCFDTGITGSRGETNSVVR